MAKPDKLCGARMLILEDDYYLATDMQSALEAAGVIVIGPFGDEAEASSVLADVEPDCAFIDVNLGHGPSFVIPLALTERAVPFAFVTGYDAETIPARFVNVPRIEKPVDAGKLLQLGRQLLRAT
jgi:two-component SAPR family response regulator